MKQAEYCDHCGDVGGYHWPGCPQAEIERVNTHSVTYQPQQEVIMKPSACPCCTINTAGQHQPNCPERVFGPDRTHYDPQPERIIRPTDHADLLRLIDGLAQTLQRRGIGVGDGSPAAVVSAAEMAIRRMEEQ